MRYVSEYITNLRRGYIEVAKRRIETEPTLIPQDLTGIHAHLRKALAQFKRKGCTHYTVSHDQSTNNTPYRYTIYKGYREGVN